MGFSYTMRKANIILFQAAYNESVNKHNVTSLYSNIRETPKFDTAKPSV
jgi:hypothetical protein